MKSILKFGIACLLALTPAAVFAATGDAILFSTDQNDPFAGSAVSLNTGASTTLYLWVTSASELTTITPATTATNPSGSPQGSAAIALSAARTGTASGVGVTGGQYYNNQYTGGFFRWSEVQAAPISNGSGGFTNFAANTAMRGPSDPDNVFYPAGTVVGLSSLSVGDTNRINVAVPGSPTPLQNAWRLGEITVAAGNTVGTATLQLSAGTLQITKGSFNPLSNTDLGPGYTFGSATITVASANRPGDFVGSSVIFPNATPPDGAINAFDIDRLASDIRNNTTNPSQDLTGGGGVTTADLDLLVGSLVDILGGGIGGLHGTHYGDANLDRTVDGSDFFTLAGNFGQNYGVNQSNWAAGDFNGDGTVDGTDFFTLAGKFGLTGAGPGAGSVAAVPEPGSLALMFLGSVALLTYRRKR